MKKIRCWMAVFLLFLLLMDVFPCACAEPISDDQLLTYYQDALFVGDSITRQLKSFLLSKSKKDPNFQFNAKFTTAQSFTLYSASRKSIPTRGAALTYNGRTVSLYEVLKQLKPGKMLILLGVNDYVGEQIEKNMGYCQRILDLTKQYSPDTYVIFFSLTPVTRSFCRKKDYRTMWDDYNAALEQLCLENGAGYMDIATDLKDEEGYLKEEYSSDGKYHLNSKGLQIWLDQLAAYAQQQYDAGLWDPTEVTK